MHTCSTTIPQHLPSSLLSDVNTICSIKIVLWGQEQMFIKLHRIALCRYCVFFLNSLVSSAFVAQKDDILHLACQSDDCWGSEALFKINSQHNAAHTDPLSLGQDYETEAEFDWATRLSSCGLELEHVCVAATLPLCCWSHALHFDKQMMHAV